VLALTAEAGGQTGETSFPRHVHVSDVVPEGGDWTYPFHVATADLGVPIGVTIVADGECQFFFPGFGCLDSQWAPDLDAELIDPDGVRIAFSQCMAAEECGFGRQETLHAMPTVAGTYRIHLYAYLVPPTTVREGVSSWTFRPAPPEPARRRRLPRSTWVTWTGVL
jgi:serine protease AprX